MHWTNDTSSSPTTSSARAPSNEQKRPRWLSFWRRRGLGFIVITLFIVSVLGGWFLLTRPLTLSPTPTPAPTPTSWPIPQRLNSPEYGANIHMWWDPWAALRRDWGLLQNAGLTWAKQRLAWQDVEGDGPGRYVWAGSDRLVQEAEEAGISLVFRVDHPPVWAVPSTPAEGGNALPVDTAAFQIFCHALAERYTGRVRGYQVWNEPNLAREWNGQVPSAEGYVAVLKACYIGIKTADPEALVISAGLAPTGSGPPEAQPDVEYLAAMYEAGAAPYFDLLGLNAPGYKAPPEISPDVVADPENGYGGHPVFCFRHAEEMRAIMERYGDGYKQVAILEFGWHTDTRPEHPDYAWFGVTPEQQGEYLVRAFQYAREHWAPWIGPMFVWNVPDSHWTPDNEEFWWGIVDPFWWGLGDTDLGDWGGGALRPAYFALVHMNKSSGE